MLACPVSRRRGTFSFTRESPHPLPRSGKHAYAQRLQELGFGKFEPAVLDELVAKFKALADEKKVRIARVAQQR